MGARLRARGSLLGPPLFASLLSVRTRRSICRHSGPVHLGFNALADSKGNSLSKFRPSPKQLDDVLRLGGACLLSARCTRDAMTVTKSSTVQIHLALRTSGSNPGNSQGNRGKVGAQRIARRHCLRSVRFHIASREQPDCHWPVFVSSTVDTLLGGEAWFYMTNPQPETIWPCPAAWPA